MESSLYSQLSVGKKLLYSHFFGVEALYSHFPGRGGGLARGKMHNITPVLTLFHVWSLYYETGEIIILYNVSLLYAYNLYAVTVNTLLANSHPQK